MLRFSLLSDFFERRRLPMGKSEPIRSSASWKEGWVSSLSLDYWHNATDESKFLFPDLFPPPTRFLAPICLEAGGHTCALDSRDIYCRLLVFENSSEPLLSSYFVLLLLNENLPTSPSADFKLIKSCCGTTLDSTEAPVPSGDSECIIYSSNKTGGKASCEKDSAKKSSYLFKDVAVFRPPSSSGSYY